ncbi:cubilin-like [Daphnia magna]|uniref:cubilin-like n=1 Tax=Daphnia magna TaxID=35525 RepID=UPI001E1BCF7A|nr:cubilin-like [Daphnia magna]
MELRHGFCFSSAFFVVGILWTVQAENQPASNFVCLGISKSEAELRKAPSETSIILNWTDSSGHSSELTAVNLQIFPDGELLRGVPERENSFIKIPHHCLKRQSDEANLFSINLPACHTCPVKWKSLDACRKYMFEIKSEYSNASIGAEPFKLETFTSQRGISPKTSFEGLWRCSSQKFFCRGIIDQFDPYASAFGATKTSGCLDNDKICNREKDCESGVDELHCAKSRQFWFIGNQPPPCNDGFQCGRQCIPNELVCDGKYDCLDGSDEHYDCEYSVSCNQLTTSFGHIVSAPITKPDEDIHKNNLMHLVQKSIIAITVQANHTIWLAFNKFRTKENHFLKVYDGPYSTSPLLLSHSGSTKPISVRSSSNNLYVEFPSYYDQSYGVDIFYASVFDKEQPFIPGCGGYIHGDGIISSWSYSSLTNPVSDCIWFVEAAQHDGIIVLKEKFDSKRNTSTYKFATLANNPIMTVYDGWNTSGRVLWDDKGLLARSSRVIYSISPKMMIRMNWPEQGEHRNTFNWHVNTIKLTITNIDGLTATSGTIKSPNYPAPYPNLADFRWNIVTAPHTKINLLFALLETQEGFDFLYVYDGPTVNSPLLLEKSGSASLPFAVNSSTNQMLVRLTSDDETTSTGFLAIYSIV